MLHQYDLVRHIRPDESGRVGNLLYEELREFVGKEAFDAALAFIQKIDQRTSIHIVQECIQVRKKLNMLWEIFGPASILYLAEKLTKHL